MAAIKIPKIITVAPVGKHTATLFFFHGSGSTGGDVKEWIDILNRKELKFSNIKIVYPTAPLQPYTPLDGLASNVWFDRAQISIRAPEVRESIDVMGKIASDLIDKEVENGISEDRIVVGGFSMGGALSMYLAYKFKPSLAGCIAMSSFLNDNSMVFEELKNREKGKTTKLLQFHGLADAMVPYPWGQKTHENLKELGVNAEWVQLPGVEHEIVQSEVAKLKEWLSVVLPEIS